VDANTSSEALKLIWTTEYLSRSSHNLLQLLCLNSFFFLPVLLEVANPKLLGFFVTTCQIHNPVTFLKTYRRKSDAA
jgi:hypothetical protein